MTTAQLFPDATAADVLAAVLDLFPGCALCGGDFATGELPVLAPGRVNRAAHERCARRPVRVAS